MTNSSRHTLKGSKETLPLPRTDDSTANDHVPSVLPIIDSAPKAPNFHAIYKDLHTKFPSIINFDKPILLAVGIRKEISKATGVSSIILKKWIAWYCRKSNYYTLHKQGAPRFNLDGSEAGIVTEGHQEKMNKRLEKVKSYQISSKRKNIEHIVQDNNLANTNTAVSNNTTQ